MSRGINPTGVERTKGEGVGNVFRGWRIGETTHSDVLKVQARPLYVFLVHQHVAPTDEHSTLSRPKALLCALGKLRSEGRVGVAHPHLHHFRPVL